MERTIRFDGGTLVLERFAPDDVPSTFVHDPRIGLPRGHAMHYHDLVLGLHRRRVGYVDEARAYGALDRVHRPGRTPRDYQQEAVSAWRAAGRRGVVVLPTGAGKSLVAELCIADANRHALVIAPTIDLVGQWYDLLRRSFGEPVGILGGGVHDIRDLCVSTYDSAWIHVDKLGNRFGLVVFDEVHHLPGPACAQAAEGSIAPFRLGLTATFERPDAAHLRIEDLVGPVVYERGISELAGNFLAEYRTECLTVHLSEEDERAYREARATYRAFVESRGIRLGAAGGWNRFLREASRSREGRLAHKAWRDSRRLLQGAPAKLRMVAELLRRHARGRCIVFTNDNATVYEVSRRLLVPALTHQTPIKERRALLEGFAEGRLPALVTSRVLNEGVDVPEADVAIVMSGTGTVREHVQRLGRILRPREGKQATLYELVVADSAEEITSARRREHDAYRQDTRAERN